MNSTEMKEVFTNRQSCRSYSSKPVEREILDEIASMARLAPSACNSQPWKLVCVNGSKAREFAECVTELGGNKFANDCPAFFVIIEGKASLSERVGARFTQSAFVQNDIGIFATHICFAAYSFGLGTCILGWRSEEKIRKLLELDKNTRVPLAVAVGYPDEKDVLREKKRKRLEDIYTYIE